MTKRKYVKIIDREAMLDELLALAQSQADRPRQVDSLLGRMLSNATCKSSSYYDEAFDLKIRAIRPDWFKKSRKRTVEYKRTLLKMARAGKMRPRDTKLSQALSHYTFARSGAHDPEFAKEILRLAPHWFLETRLAKEAADVVRAAEDGLSRPRGAMRFLRPASRQYDEEMAAHIRSLRPDWFSSTERLKNMVIEHAIRDGSRPSQKKDLRLYQAFRRYTRVQEKRDDEFTALLQSLRPEWFLNYWDQLRLAKQKLG